ncbi:MAG: ArnT family glycosyltransferase [Ktedonobacteraceae bacterium]
MSSTATITKDTIQSTRQHPARRWYRVFYSPLWLCLLAALLLRVWLIVRTGGVIDGDEALVGIQAERILHGEFPIYFYGQPYMGSLEAYLVALLFALFGASVWTLRVEPTLLSLLIIWLTWKLAGILADMANLAPHLKRCFMTIAVLCAVVPPLYDAVIELRTLGGYIETFVFMLWLLLSVVQLVRRWTMQVSRRELALRWAGIGLLIGLGFWVNSLIISAVITSALWIFGARSVVEIRRLRGIVPEKACVSTGKGLLLGVAAIPAAVIGFAPAILWGAMNQWRNISFIVHLGSNSGSVSQRFQTIQQVWQLYHTCIAPRIIGGGLPSESALLVRLHMPLVYAGTLGILAAVAMVLLSLFWRQSLLVRIRRLALLPLLFAACSAIIFCLSPASTSGLLSCNADFAGRYATPLLLTLPFIFAAICIFIVNVGTALARPHPQPDMHNAAPGRGRLTAPTADLSASAPHSGMSPLQETRGQGTRADQSAVGAVNRPLRGDNRFAPIIQAIVLVLVLLYVGMQAITCGLTDPGMTFQSPYCSIGPANNGPIIAYMQQQHIRYAWATNFLAYPIVFKTDSQIIAADPLPLMHPKIAINRIPAYTAMVMHADRPSFLVFVRHGDAHPSLLRTLASEGVTYRYAVFPSEPGVDVLIVTPLNRTVLPTSSKAFDIFYCSI